MYQRSGKQNIWSTLLFAICILAMLLSGCKPAAPTAAPEAKPTAVSEKPTEASVPTKASAPTEAPTEAPSGTGECKTDWNPTFPAAEKFDPAVEISVPFGTDYSFMLEGDEITNNPMYNRLVEQLGIKYTIAWQADGNDVYTRLNNDMAAGTLPDAFRVKNSKLSTYIDAGAVEDITDLWEKYASDLAKQKKGYPDSMLWLDVKRDGRLYGISYKEDGFGDDSLTYVRQDWLDQLGLKAPTTIDEITEVARAFKAAGLAEFPIAANVNLVTWQWSLDPVFGAFGVIPASGGGPGYWLKGEDGALHYSSIDPRAQEALKVLNLWYTEGLINPDFINMDESAAGDAFIAGQVGIGFQPWWGGHANVMDLYAANPAAKISVIPNPLGPDGKSGRAGTSMRAGAVLFRKGVDPIKIEAVIKQINWQVEMHANWDKYQQYGEWIQAAGYFKGYEWDLDENCQMVIGKLPGTEWMYARDFVGGYRGSSYPDYVADTFGKMAEWLAVDPATLNMAQKFILGDPTTLRDIEYYNKAYDSRGEIIFDAFKGRNTDAINEVLSDLLDFERAAYLEFITGARSLDAFDQFVAEWLERGGQVYTDEVNQWATESGN